MFSVEQLRQFRIAGYALFDFVASFLGIALLAPLLSKFFRLFKLEIPTKSWILLTLPLSIGIHLLFGTYTQMTKDFLDPTGHFILKSILIGLFIWGMKDIRRTISKK